MDKNKVPYYQAAKEALMKWNGLTEEEADKMIAESSFEEIEAQVDAKSSMTSAAKSIGKSLGLNEKEISQFIDEIFGRTESTEISDELCNRLKKATLTVFRSTPEKSMHELVVDAMEAVHDNWIKDKAGLFFNKKAEKEQQFQYLPLELIGWDEAKSDLLFIKPIIERIGGYIGKAESDISPTKPVVHEIGTYIDETKIKEECNRRTVKYFERLTYSNDEGTLGMKVKNLADLGYEIAENGLLDNYDPLDTIIEGTDMTLREAMENREFVNERLLPQLRKKGFIKDKELIYELADKNIFEVDGPSRDEVIEELLKDESFTKNYSEYEINEELEYLREKKQKLQEQQNKIAEAEKMVDAKDNQAPNIDE